MQAEDTTARNLIFKKVVLGGDTFQKNVDEIFKDLPNC